MGHINRRPKLVGASLFVLAASVAGSADAETGGLEVRTSQAGYLHTIEARQAGNGYDGQTGYYDMLIQNIAVANTSDSNLELKSVWVEISKNNEVVQRVAVPASEIVAGSNLYNGYAGMGFQPGLEVVFGAQRVVDEGERVSVDLALEPGEFVIATDSYIVTRGSADSLKIIAMATDANGNNKKAVAELEVRSDLSKNEYIFPLEAGEWYITGFPGIGGHHRFTQSTEFGMDITLVDGDGNKYKDDGHKWTDWYAYGKKVFAAADGEVVRIAHRSDHDLETAMPQGGETEEEYEARFSQKQFELFMAEDADLAEVAGGNYVRIKHANGEYSHYAHLAFGSIKVKVGDKVKQGQQIASVGGTGESPNVHLHFQINETDGGDHDNYANHSIPPRFTNVELPGGVNLNEEPGYWVEVGEAN